MLEKTGKRRESSPRLQGTAVAMAAALTALACSTASEYRFDPQGPTLHTLSQEELKTTMGTLASMMLELEDLMASYPEKNPQSAARIPVLLEEMFAATQPLGPAGWPSSHPQISARVGLLRDDLHRARLAAEREPPNYYWAGTVSSACTYCHAPPL